MEARQVAWFEARAHTCTNYLYMYREIETVKYKPNKKLFSKIFSLKKKRKKCVGKQGTNQTCLKIEFPLLVPGKYEYTHTHTQNEFS